MEIVSDGITFDDLISDAVKDERCVDKCKVIAECIQKKSSELLTLVEKLGSVLTDMIPEKREKGIIVLAEVLTSLPDDFLQDSELKFITTFFCDRLKDHAVVIPAVLQGILSVVKMKNLPKGTAAQIATALFQNIQCQTLKQQERNIIYSILQEFQQSYAEELKLLGPDFVYGVITMIDGERDPRNLLLVYNILPHFMKTFTLGHLTEEMFEVIACYFPVDFYSSPNDPNAITRDVLAVALEPCLTAVPEFAEFCIPLLLEKLDSQLRVAKLDSLKLLQSCCENFTLEGMEKFLYDLCHSLHRELIPGTDKEVYKEARTTLTTLIHKISSVPVDKNQANLLQSILATVIRDCVQYIQDVQFSSFLPAAHALVAVAQASSAACHAVVKVVIPILLSQYNKGSSTEGKVVLLQTLSIFLALCESYEVTPKSISELTPLWAESSSIYMEGVQHSEPEVRKQGIHGFIVLVKSVSSDTRLAFYDILCNTVKKENSLQVRQEAIVCLKEFSKLYPDEIMEHVIFSKLQNFEGSGDASDSLIQSRSMDALCEIAVVEPFTTCIVPQFLDFVTCIPEVGKCSIGIKCLRKLVELPEAGPNMHRYLYVHCGAISRLVSWWMHGIQEGSHPEIFYNHDLLIDSAKILSTILRTQSNSVQFDVVSEFVPKFMEPELNLDGGTFRVFDPSSPWHHTQSVLLLEALLSTTRQDVNIPLFQCLVLKLVDLSIYSSHTLTSKTSARFVACLLNKAEDDEALSNLLFELITLLTVKSELDAPINEASNAVTTLSWITKALIMRSYREIDVWIQKLVNLLSYQTIGKIAADGFKLIMVDEEDYLNTNNYCNIRILYRQRFFQIVPNLITNYSTADDSVKSNYLVALAFLLQGAPRVVVNMSLSELIPLLVESLEQKDEALLLTSMETLNEMLELKQPVLIEHINTFLPRFLNLAKFKESMKVRITALKCLLQVCNFPTHIILPYKQKTLHGLGICLDDPKRLVRRQAVITRSKWFLVGAPGEPQNS